MREPRDLLALVRVRAAQGAAEKAVRGTPCRREAARQHHRPELRHLQHAERPRRDPAPRAGHRRRGEHGVPARLAPGRRLAAGRSRRQRLHVPRVRSHALRGARTALPAGTDRPALDDQVPALARRAPRPRSRALHRAREAHHDQADLGPLALGDAGLLRHCQLRGLRQRDLHPRPAPLPRRRDGAAVQLRDPAAGRGRKPTARRSASSAATSRLS